MKARWRLAGIAIVAGLAAAWILTDPEGEYDAALVAALETALKADDPPPEHSSGYEWVTALGPLSREEFVRRVRSVQGWELLVVYEAYQEGVDWRHPALTSWRLRWLIRNDEGLPQDGHLWVLVVRDQKVVGYLGLASDCEIAGVVTREP